LKYAAVVILQMGNTAHKARLSEVEEVDEANLLQIVR
jgi:hypothetical protein